VTTLATLLPTLLGVAVLALVTLAVLTWTGAPERFGPMLAILRGAAQLAVISLILTGVIQDPRWVAAALLVMFGVATVTATRRLGWSRSHLLLVAGAMAAGVVVVLAVVFATGSIVFSARYALAIGGIVIGNSMSIATLAGRRFLQSVDEQWDQVESWLALGATPRDSTRDLARRAVHLALIPSTDQTKTTGLVTLPGAFVGAIFGGVSPLEAGRFQIVVLAAIMGAGAITAAMVVGVLAPVSTRPATPR
jgi:putative ABC transport system permease protein